MAFVTLLGYPSHRSLAYDPSPGAGWIAFNFAYLRSDSRQRLAESGKNYRLTLMTSNSTAEKRKTAVSSSKCDGAAVFSTVVEKIFISKSDS
ncbi:hypothetical protein I6N90_16485 [Paenibacillus sp. GSMTC-2017]|uniref:hypothetical protein n=1 Tax=Paenibacillus sp. GSMTC-2017 TaxID=2794350 RepID=UPI0018D7CC30|nr:hypothetical protein [Paenibacillus sp. GSMTC-2017]MBH5319397.1 hypothetical protein [Paenibacillus sp. GSMTC-2017]